MLARRRILLDVTAGAGATVALAFVVMGSTIVLARQLSVEQFGKISLMLLFFNLTSVFDAVRPVTIYFANRHPSDRDAVFASVFWLDALIGVALGAVISLIAFGFAFELFSRGEILCFAGVFMLFFLQSAYWGWADAHGLVARTSVLRAAVLAAVYLSFIALSFTGAQGRAYALVLLVASVLALALFWNVCRAHGLIGGGLAWPRSSLMAAIGSEVGRYMQFNAATLVLATADRLAISTQAGARPLGLYSGHFELASRPMALVRALQSALSPHITKATMARTDVFPVWGKGTKLIFVLVSLGAWSAVLMRNWLIPALLGPQYAASSGIFALVVLAQCFVVLGYASALLLNAFGDFRLQKTYYVVAALVMGAAVLPAAELVGIAAVAAVYFAVRTVDVWLLLAAVRRVGRRPRWTQVLVLAFAWCFTGYAAWHSAPLLTAAGALIFALLLVRLPLSLRAAGEPLHREEGP